MSFAMLLSLLAFSTLLRFAAANVPVPVVLPFNDTHFFGYDGPWQAVPVLLSWPDQQLVNLYPGGTFLSALLSNNVANYEQDYTGQRFTSASGVYDASLPKPAAAGSSENFAFAGPDNSGVNAVIDGGWNGGEPSKLKGAGLLITDNVFHRNFGWVNNFSFAAVYDANYDLPDGRQIPLDVGFLSLGAQNNQLFDSYVGKMISLDLSANAVSESNTWGLHVGSVRHKIPGSLVFGGYDMARVIGDISTSTSQDGNGNMFINLLDISIGVAKGGSPFPFQEKSGLLRNLENNTQTIKTRPNPTVPYLYLPENTCKTIAAYLPVTYLPSLDLYTWNTDSPKYEEIVSSPAFLAFTFQRTGAQGDLTVNVPFSLLNLTLTSPLVSSPTPYFPCKSFIPKKPSDSLQQGDYHLGRAFLQAAFIGMNWNNSKWWMAQAPGPQALLPTVTSLQNSSETITAIAGQSLWASSWDGIWTPLPEQETNNNDAQPLQTDESGLSTGAKVGIAVGAVVGVAALGGAAYLVFRNRKRTSNDTSSNQSGVPLNEPGRSHSLQAFKSELPGWESQHSSVNWATKPPVQVLHEMPTQHTPTLIDDQSYIDPHTR
jgi:hypothetical protein